MTLLDWYAGGLNVIIIALCEVCGIAWIYGRPIYCKIYIKINTMGINRLRTVIGSVRLQLMDFWQDNRF